MAFWEVKSLVLVIYAFFLTAFAFAISAEKEAFMIMIISVLFPRGLCKGSECEGAARDWKGHVYSIYSTIERREDVCCFRLATPTLIIKFIDLLCIFICKTLQVFLLF
jgi:hypothetical protein